MMHGYMDKLKKSLGMGKAKMKQSLKVKANGSKNMEKVSGAKTCPGVSKMEKVSKKLSGMSKEHAKEYAKYSPAQLKKHMKGEKMLLGIKIMAKKKK